VAKLASVDLGLDSGHSLGVVLWDTCTCHRSFGVEGMALIFRLTMSLHVIYSTVLEDAKHFATSFLSSRGG